MRIVDKIVNKIRTDKLLHFLVTGWTVAEWGLPGFAIIIILGIIKECLDDKFDLEDLQWSLYGGLLAMLL